MTNLPHQAMSEENAKQQQASAQMFVERISDTSATLAAAESQWTILGEQFRAQFATSHTMRNSVRNIIRLAQSIDEMMNTTAAKTIGTPSEG